MDEWFGIVRWCNEDIANALETEGYEPTEENVKRIRSILEKHWFEDAMIEAGWNYIYATIRNELPNPT